MRRWSCALLIVAIAAAGCSSDELATAPPDPTESDSSTTVPDAEPLEEATATLPADEADERDALQAFGDLELAADGVMPPLSEAFQPRFDAFYKGVFLADGYPGRRIDDETIVAHPIYGVYVLNDYITQLRQTDDEEQQDALRTGIQMVADSAIARMEDVGDTGALGFYYEPEWGLGARITERHYSGLTQAYYALALERAAQALELPAYSDAASRVYDSLLVPSAEGGVLIPDETGPAFAELPSEPESYVLNGWLSVLSTMINYGNTVQDPEVIATVESSVDRLLELLPLYDVPEFSNSRYGLSGFITVRVVASVSGLTIGDVILDVNDGTPREIPVNDGEDGRWSTFLFAEDFEGDRLRGEALRGNLVLSMVSFPEVNELIVEFEADDDVPVEFTLEARVGRYDPAWTGPVDQEWQNLSTGTVDGGKVTFELPWEAIGPVIYPTNFAKDIDGQSANVYHLIHVNRLRQVSEALSIPELLVWADRWEAAVCDWDTLDLYEGFAVSVKGQTVPVEEVDDSFAWCGASG